MHPRAGTALAPHFESALAKGALDERDSVKFVTENETIVNDYATQNAARIERREIERQQRATSGFSFRPKCPSK